MSKMSTMYSTLSFDNYWNERNKNLSIDYLQKLQGERFEIFKSQNLENGHFDVAFDIEGKILHAHKFTIAAVSETLNAMISARWTKKDEPVKIESYTYDNFYQFISFLYTGKCRLTSLNVFQLVDIAEFYAVPCLKEFCEQYLSDMKKTPETIEELYEFADKYSLPKLQTSIKDFVLYRKSGVFAIEQFRDYKKPFVKFLSTINRDPDYVIKSPYWAYQNESGFFECVYKWAEHQVTKQKRVGGKNFNLQKAIKTELHIIIPHPQFSKMNFEFLKDFVVEKGFLLSAIGFNNFFTNFCARQHSDTKEILFKSVYELAEKQALKKQSIADQNGKSFNVADSMKADLVKVIPHVKFFRMDKQFLMDFIVENGFILSPTDFCYIFQLLLSENEQQKFNYIYKLSEKQALKKQMMATKNGESFDVSNSIKFDLAEVMPRVKFHHMDEHFLMDFVVANQIITEEQANHVHDTRVIINSNDKLIIGAFKDDIGLRQAVENQLSALVKQESLSVTCRSTKLIRFSKLKFSVPKTPSTVTKMKGVDWYLCLEKDGILAFKHYSRIERRDYLLAEMKSDTEFELITKETIGLTASYKNVDA